MRMWLCARTLQTGLVLSPATTSTSAKFPAFPFPAISVTTEYARRWFAKPCGKKEDPKKLVAQSEKEKVKPGSLPLDWQRVMAGFPTQNEHIQQFQKSLGFTFKQPALLFEAFTHKSAWTHEVWQEVIPRERQCYENLECVGDSVLNLIVLDKLVSHGSKSLLQTESGKDDWQHFNEGWLTEKRSALVRAETLHTVAHELGFPKCIMAQDGLTEGKMAGDTVESVIAAIYYDQGYQITKRIVSRWLRKRIRDLPLPGQRRKSRLTMDSQDEDESDIEDGDEDEDESEDEGVRTKAKKEGISSDVVESIIGALYFDKGFEETRRLVSRVLQKRVSHLTLDGEDRKVQLKTDSEDGMLIDVHTIAGGSAKSRLLSIFSGKVDRVRFERKRVDGPDHAPVFEVRLLWDDRELASGRGTNVRQAENAAASTYLEKYDKSPSSHFALVYCKGKHPREFVNEVFQRSFGKLPDWVRVEVTGADHEPKFTVALHLNNFEVARGVGRAMNLAKEQATFTVVQSMNKEYMERLSAKCGLRLVTAQVP